MERELRLGNLILNDQGLVSEVSEVNNRVVYSDVDGVHSLVIYPKGIELTSDWLDKFGFEKISLPQFKNIKLNYWAKDAVLLFYNESPPYNTYLIGVGDYISNFDGTGEYIAITKRWITNVHDLQNWFYQWTGRELELTK